MATAMKYRKLGSTGLAVSVVGLGTYQFSGAWGKQFSAPEIGRIVAAAHDAGVNFIDTAECYGDHLAERLLGQAIPPADRGDWIFATKFGHRHRGPAEHGECWSPAEVLLQLEDSLRALRTDYVDLYQFHSGGDDAFDNDELWTTLDKQVRAGKIRHLGLSLRNAAVEHGDMHQIGACGERNIRTLQIVYNKLFRDAAAEALPLAQANGLGVIGRVPLAKGYLSCRYTRGTRFSAGDHRAHATPEQHADLVGRAEAAHKDEPADASMAQRAIAWALSHPSISTVVVGTKDVSQIMDSANAAHLLADEETHPMAVSSKRDAPAHAHL